MRRLQRIAVSPEFLVEVMKNGLDRVVIVGNPLPPDARYLYATFEPMAAAVWLFVESTTFAEIGDGERVPIAPLTVFQKADGG